MNRYDDAHPVLLHQPLAAHAGQLAVLTRHLCLALLQRRHQLAALHLHLQVEQVEGGLCLDILDRWVRGTGAFKPQRWRWWRCWCAFCRGG